MVALSLKWFWRKRELGVIDDYHCTLMWHIYCIHQSSLPYSSVDVKSRDIGCIIVDRCIDFLDTYGLFLMTIFIYFFSLQLVFALFIRLWFVILFSIKFNRRMNQEISHDFHFYVTSGVVVHKNYPFTPQHQYAYSPNCSLCSS